MSKVSNVFTMLELLSNGQKYSISELSKRIEVSNRMIRQYKDELEMAGIYIDTIRGPYGGYILNQNVMLPNRGFSKYDLELLNIIKKDLPIDFEFKDKLNDLIDKLDGIYKGSKKKPANELLEIKSNSDKYNIVNKAIKNKNKLFINYKSLSNDGMERVIHPCHIFLHNNDFYLSAYCELRSEIRHFEFSRIISIDILSDKYDTIN